MKQLYVVTKGVVGACNESIASEINWTDRALCYCHNTTEALELCRLYDSGLIQPDNVAINGVTICVLDID